MFAIHISFQRNKIFLLLLSMTLLMSCNESVESQRVSRYLSSISSLNGETTPEASKPTELPQIGGAQSISTAQPSKILGGTPHSSKDGFCGDGIINGTAEDCDQNAIQNVACQDYGAISGTVTCQPNCLYDISGCITPEVNRRIGGLTETCKCYCNNNRCDSACRPLADGVVGVSDCEISCDSRCQCNCLGNLEVVVERCDYECKAIIDATGNPQLECVIDKCDVLASINKNIATLVTASSPNLIGR